MEALTPALVDEMELLVDLLPAETHVLVLDPERVRRRAHDLVATSEEFLGASWAAAASGGESPIDLGAASYRALGDVRAHALAAGQSWWTVSPFGLADDTEAVLPDLDDTDMSGVPTRTLPMQAADAYRGDVDRAFADLARWRAEGFRTVVVHPGHGPAQRTVEALGERDVAARLVDALEDAPAADVVTVACGALTHGFVDEANRLVLLTGEDISGQRASTRDMRRMPARRKRQIDPLELAAGDYVVHEQHGVGRFVEMRQREVAGAVREYLVLEYGASKRGGPPDRLYVPADALDQVTRYVGGEQPSLDRLGGADWGKRKGRARKAVRQIAAELIKLYAARQATKGHAFGPDTPWQRELEDAFPFTETPDQLTTVDEVKDDMMKTVPMDRLVCGDVGYGKTEIAVRAAFKAVQDGKQVAVLVPTTLLVTQHLSTFQERMSGFPIRIEALSRFQTDKEARAVVDGLADGTVDIVVGTHRLLNPDIRVKDLGLIIVDEEQRFGVEHKEQMKRLRTSVDVLSMSATPIPRTLEMAITGIREMSTITTPPEERHPVLTYVGGYEDRQVTAAVRRELLREGQVFYIHNRVQSIEKAAAKIRELVPEARVAVAHGQMGEHQLEQVMLDFWEKTFDVLVCTTIVESGLDVSNANTMIIERADTLGLSQLHQLRGRVGRSPRARLRLLPLPGREAAHRDRPRAAGHAGPALRPRRRHGDRDEGPRDPRRRQPARRRAVRPHRRRRLRPLRPAGRRGGARVPRRRGARAQRGPHRAARRRPPAGARGSSARTVQRAAEPAAASGSEQSQRLGVDGGREAVRGAVADHDRVAVSHLVCRRVSQRSAVEVEVQSVAAEAGEAADAVGPQLHAPHGEEVAEQEAMGVRRLHVDDPGLVVRVEARVDALRSVDADVRRDRAEDPVDIDAQQRVDVESLGSRRRQAQLSDALLEVGVLRSPRRLRGLEPRPPVRHSRHHGGRGRLAAVVVAAARAAAARAEQERGGERARQACPPPDRRSHRLRS